MKEKQDKVLQGINRMREWGNKTPLGTKPNDECYTSMQDILNELSNWAEMGKFKGKNIICPCDWDIVAEENIYSIKITYNDNEVDVNGNVINKVESVIYDMWDEVQDNTVKLQLKENEIDDFLRNKLTCNFVRTLVQNARRWGIKSITASGYNPLNGKGTPFQEINYKDYDICITNPPFSLYSKFMECIVGNIDFICLAPLLNRVNPNIGLPLMLKKAYIGFSGENGGEQGFISMNFYNPTSTNKYKTKCVACDWITSFSEAQDARNIRLENHKTGVDYELYKDEYDIMENITMKDGTHPIRVSASQAPDNYDGWMFSSINFLTKFDLRQYEWYGTNFKKYYNTTCPEDNPFNHNASDDMLIYKGKQAFHGIVFRKKPQAKEN